MLEEVGGLPLHPLTVHAPVVLVPLLALAALAYALVPAVRARVSWVAATLAVAAPVSAVLAKLSGEAMRNALYAATLPDDHPVVAHARAGDWLMWSSIALGAVTLTMVFLRREGGLAAPRWLWWLGATMVVVLAGLTLWFSVQAGHTGAEMTHGGRLPG